MKRILCILPSLDTGGAETFMMKLFRTMDNNKIKVDFCVSSYSKGYYEDEIIKLGGEIFHISKKTDNFFLYFNDLFSLLKRKKYDAVLRIGASCFTMIDLWIAWLAGVKNRALRSSNSNFNGNMFRAIHKILRFPLSLIINIKIAPSILAAEFTFGKKSVMKGDVFILNNALDLKDYRYSEKSRLQIREKYNLGDNLVFGNIGRFNIQKNHMFLIDVFYEIKKKSPSSKLVLIGKGELESIIIKKLEKLKLLDSVIFTGVVDNVQDYLSAFDVLIFPSYFEGMPNAVIEAQSCGLPCIVSDTITKEVDLTKLVKFLKLGNAMEWSNIALSSVNLESRRNFNNNILKETYDINLISDQFTKIIFTKETW